MKQNRVETKLQIKRGKIQLRSVLASVPMAGLLQQKWLLANLFPFLLLPLSLWKPLGVFCFKYIPRSIPLIPEVGLRPHAPLISSITFWDALNWPKPNKGTAWVENWILRGLFGEKKIIIVTDLVVSLVSSLGPEHTELVFVLQVNFPAKCKLVGCLSHSCILNFHFYVTVRGRK